MANDGYCRLGASLWGPDEDGAYVLAEKNESGVLWVNETRYLPQLLGFGGMNQSDLGVQRRTDGLNIESQDADS